jgi:hypothetical protein
MGMAKSADVAVKMNVTQTPTNNFLLSNEYIPLELYKFFSIDPSVASEIEERQLKKVLECVYQGNIGDALRKLKQAEIKVGQPAIGETRLSKVFNYITIKNRVNVIKTDKNLDRDRIKARVTETEKIAKVFER